MNRQLRYEGSRLDEVLARIREDHGDDANIVAAEQVRAGGIAGFFAKEHYEVTVVPADPDATPEPEPEPEPAVPTGSVPATAAPALSSLEQNEPEEPIGPVPGTRFADMLAELIEDDVERTDTLELSSRPDLTSATPHGEPRPRGLRPPATPTMPTTPAPAAPATAHDRPTELAPLARQAGPTELAEMCGAPVSVGELIGMVTRRMRPAPSLPTDGVIAVVGARGDAVNAAVGLARAVGQLASDVLVAAPSEGSIAPEHMSATVRATIRQRERRGRTGPTLVVVVVEPGRSGHRWATSLLALLDASQTRLALAGWRPVERLGQTIEGLGGVDVVDVVDLESAEAPDRLLDLGVPVGTIDGEPSTVEAWVAVIASTDPTEVVVVPPAAPSADRTPLWDAVASASARGLGQ